MTALPMQLINILTLGSPEGVGVFFPDGLLGAINKPTGYASSAPGTNPFPPGTGPGVAVSVWLPPACMRRPSPTSPARIPPSNPCVPSPFEGAATACRG
jgi:hypothetical protein